MKKSLFILLFLPLFCIAQQQEYYLGAIIDQEAYDNTPVKAQQLSRSYASMPRSHSLIDYCPTPRSQGQYGTCTSWAIAYAARTIAEAYAKGCTDPAKNTQEAFSPTFVYTLIKNPDEQNCQSGTSIDAGLKLLKDKGVPKLSSFYHDCSNYVPADVFPEAAKYKIEDYFTLFHYGADANKKIEATKMAICQNRPVIISMKCYNSFSYANAQWDGRTDVFRGFHAMCVVGYDDDMYGGAFKIMNSWGSYWGENGFTWVKYQDYTLNVDYAYEMYLGKYAPSPKYALSGEMEIRLATSNTMPVSLSNNGSYQVYQAYNSYPSGTRYRIMLSNNEPAYVYVIGSDNTGLIETIFPPTPQISPALVYSSNNIAIPDEQWYIETDQTIGTDYLCVLYSKTALSIEAIISDIKNQQGSFPQRVTKALNDVCVPNEDINFRDNTISFSTSSSQTVVPIIVEIPHGK